MHLEQESRGDILILRPIGRLDSASAGEFERALTERIGDGATRIVLDFSRLNYISSAGLRAMLLGVREMRARDGRLVLVGLQEMVRSVFDMSGFLPLFTVTQTLEDGLAAA
jgi:anti-anti-sigma factor